MLPYTLEFYKLRDDLTWSLVSEDGHAGSVRHHRQGVRGGGKYPTTLTDLGVAPERIDAIIAAAAERPELRRTPGGATERHPRADRIGDLTLAPG